jgi:hypothetical protein
LPSASGKRRKENQCSFRKKTVLFERSEFKVFRKTILILRHFPAAAAFFSNAEFCYVRH